MCGMFISNRSITVSFAGFASIGGDFVIEGASVVVVLPDGVLVDEPLAACFDALGGCAPFLAFERV